MLKNLKFFLVSTAFLIFSSFIKANALLSPITGLLPIPRPYVGIGYSFLSDVSKYKQNSQDNLGHELARFHNTNLHLGVSWGMFGVQLTYGTLNKFIQSPEFGGVNTGTAAGGNFRTEYTALNGVIRLYGLELGVASFELLANAGVAQMSNMKVSGQTYSGEPYNYNMNKTAFTYGLGVQANLLHYVGIKVGVDVFEVNNNYINTNRLIVYNTALMIYPFW